MKIFRKIGKVAYALILFPLAGCSEQNSTPTPLLPAPKPVPLTPKPFPTRTPRSQARINESQRYFLDLAFAKRRRVKDKARVVVTMGFGLSLLPGTRDLRVGSLFHCQQKDYRHEYRVKSIDAGGITIQFDEGDFKYPATGEARLKWKP